VHGAGKDARARAAKLFGFVGADIQNSKKTGFCCLLCAKAGAQPTSIHSAEPMVEKGEGAEAATQGGGQGSGTDATPAPVLGSVMLGRESARGAAAADCGRECSLADAGAMPDLAVQPAPVARQRARQQGGSLSRGQVVLQVSQRAAAAAARRLGFVGVWARRGPALIAPPRLPVAAAGHALVAGGRERGEELGPRRGPGALPGREEERRVDAAGVAAGGGGVAEGGGGVACRLRQLLMASFPSHPSGPCGRTLYLGGRTQYPIK
jgi:hypothetical protein